MGFLQELGVFMKRSPTGREAWKEFIQGEAIEILRHEEPPRGAYPQGSFQSLTTVEADFFSSEARDRQDATLMTNMLFLTNVLMGMHPAPNQQNHRGNEEEEVAPPDGTGPNAASVNPDDSSDATHVPDIVGYEPNPNRHDAATMRFRRVSNFGFGHPQLHPSSS
ncbi:hypothetical protein PtA15_7A156 [Puccinia triticina]|uniref:Uncharacterized protein n=1 Tax=Puccinia triticina TaxID=208348 RepID=A0ABY7CP13_9BASI|nr:uncharacterized protein PtA15_7A156 [Puccinia triticina]WAQ86430.1 hypothetical protein PtA15_7A156 [Puccinia triticina]